MADPLHLLKSVRNCLLTQSIILPPSVVVEKQLPSSEVNMQHIKQLIELQDCMDLLVAPTLKAIHVNPGNFQKMKVGMAAQLLSHSTASALKFCVARKLLPDEA